jgi:hypothetical protein
MLRNKLIVGTALAAMITSGIVGTVADQQVRESAEGPVTAQIVRTVPFENVAKLDKSKPVAVPKAEAPVVAPAVTAPVSVPTTPAVVSAKLTPAAPVAPAVVPPVLDSAKPVAPPVAKPPVAPNPQGQGAAMGNAGKNAPVGPPPAGVTVSPVYGQPPYTEGNCPPGMKNMSEAGCPAAPPVDTCESDLNDLLTADSSVSADKVTAMHSDGKHCTISVSR